MSEKIETSLFLSGAPRCEQCKNKLNAATGEGSPQAGDVSVCAYCGAVAIYTSDMQLRQPTTRELGEVERDPFFQKLISLVRRP